VDLIRLLTTPNAAEAFLNELAEVIRLDDPRFGRFGANELADYYAKFQGLVDGYDSLVEAINSIEQDNSRLEETELHLHGEQRSIRLPIAIVYDQTGQGLHIRLYYSNQPIDQTNKDHSALLGAGRDLTLPAPVASYQKAFAAGDLDATLAAIEPSATIREPGGGTFGPAPGQTGLKDFYTFLYSFGGGIPLQHCNAIVNDRSCAIEYNIVQVGNNSYSPQPGVAIYDFNEHRVTGVRIYDDFVPSH
jgi:hypothetical protein